MNERIQALADLAEDYADGIVDAGGEFHPAYTQKLAELIVRECMSLMKEEKDYYDNPGIYETEKYYIQMKAKAEAIDDASSIIKNYFGVE